MARARKHAAKDELHGRRARPDRVYRGEGLEPQQEDSRNAAIKCAKVQTLVKRSTLVQVIDFPGFYRRTAKVVLARRHPRRYGIPR